MGTTEVVTAREKSHVVVGAHVQVALEGAAPRDSALLRAALTRGEGHPDGGGRAGHVTGGVREGSRLPGAPGLPQAMQPPRPVSTSLCVSPSPFPSLSLYLCVSPSRLSLPFTGGLN